MYKVIFGLLAMAAFSGTANAGMSYECWAYKNGSPQWMTHVVANNKSEAENKAAYKFKNDFGKRFDYVKCK